MLYRLLLPLLLVVVAAGCSSVRTVSPAGEQGVSHAQLNRAVRGKVVKVRFREGRSISVTGLHLAGDSLTWVDQRGNELRSARTADVAELQIVKASRGALAGLVVGAVVGAGVGTARAYMQGDDPASDLVPLTLEQKLHTFPIAHALYGALGVTPLGAIIGGRSTYRFETVPLPAAERLTQTQ